MSRFVDVGAHLVGHEHHDDVGLGGRLGGLHHLETRGLGLGPRGSALAQADDDVDAAVAQVVGVRVPLAAVSDDGDFLPCRDLRDRRLS
jgi:hypothetical protein